MSELIKMLLGELTRVGTNNPLLYGVHIQQGRGAIFGCCAVYSKSLRNFATLRTKTNAPFFSFLLESSLSLPHLHCPLQHPISHCSPLLIRPPNLILTYQKSSYEVLGML